MNNDLCVDCIYKKFDYIFYQENNKDLNNFKNKEELWNHYRKYGIKENRKINKNNNINCECINICYNCKYKNFNWIFYKNKYSDLNILKNKDECWEHYINFGENENRLINENIKYNCDCNIKKNLIYSEFYFNTNENYLKDLIINYHCYNRNYFSFDDIGLLPEGLHHKKLKSDIHITFTFPKLKKDKKIIDLLLFKYSKFDCNIFVHYRKNEGADPKTIFTTLDFCRKNKIKYKWFYHIHTKTIKSVRIENIVFYNSFENVYNLIDKLQINTDFSLFGNRIHFYNLNNEIINNNCLFNNFNNFLNLIESKIKFNYNNSKYFFGGNIWIGNFNYLNNIIDNINLNKLLNLMKEPNNHVDLLWINLMLNSNSHNLNQELIKKAYNNSYIPTGNCYSLLSLTNNILRDQSIMHLLERLIPYFLILYSNNILFYTINKTKKINCYKIGTIIKYNKINKKKKIYVSKISFK